MRNIGVAEKVDHLSQLNLPPGFRFHPTDEEIMVNYLCPKIVGQNLPFKIIADVDLYKYDPWVLPSKALFGEDEWYFFTLRDRKYPKGSRPNRVAGSGYWKATGTDKAITSEGKHVGIKKALVFYIGKAPRGSKTDWIMHEYRLSEPQRRTGKSKLNDLVLCRIHKKNSSAQNVDEMGMAGMECIHNSSSSSSSKFNEPLHVSMNDHSFSMNQLNDWVTFAGLNNTIPENFGSSSGIHFPIHNITERGVMNPIIHYNQDDMYVPAADTRYGRMTQLEVQNEFINQGVDNSGFLNPNAYPQGFINSIDPDATVRYPNQPGNSGHKN